MSDTTTPTADSTDSDATTTELEPGDTIHWDGHTERVIDTGEELVTETVYESEAALLNAATATDATVVPANRE